MLVETQGWKVKHYEKKTNKPTPQNHIPKKLQAPELTQMKSVRQSIQHAWVQMFLISSHQPSSK